MPMDLPPDVDLVNEQESVIEVPLSGKYTGPFDSVDPEFIAWAEERGIDLDRDDARQLVMAEYERTNPEKTFLVNGIEHDDFFGNMMRPMWHTFNFDMYKMRKEAGFPPVNPDPEDGFFSRAAAQQQAEEMSQNHRRFLEEAPAMSKKFQDKLISEGKIDAD